MAKKKTMMPLPNGDLIDLSQVKKTTLIEGKGVVLAGATSRLLAYIEEANVDCARRIRDCLNREILAVEAGKDISVPDWAQVMAEPAAPAKKGDKPAQAAA